MRSRWFLLLLLGSTLAVIQGCTDSDPPSSADETPPDVSVVFPLEFIDNLIAVSDSTDVWIVARDESSEIEAVTAWFQREDQSNAQMIGSTSTLGDVSQAPDSVQQLIEVPPGFSLYSVFWRTQLIPSGTNTQVFATAEDGAGNVQRSESNQVVILNGVDLEPPDPVDFDIQPPTGDISTTFFFDPSLTEDRIDNDADIQVRWDFDGDGIWDIDWDADARANETQSWIFVRAETYFPKLEARNTYVEEANSSAPTIRVSVTPLGGCPDPLRAGWQPGEGADFARIPPGVYPRGASNPVGASENEFPVHQVRLTSESLLLKREVTNQEYLNYLQEALPNNDVFFGNNEIWGVDSTGALTDRYMDFDNSRLFFNIDSEAFLVEDGFADHPVTGVTWYGATAYAVNYGLRLPTEAEWEVAARADNANWRFPYGEDLRDGDKTGQKRINYVESGDPFDGDRGTTPVGYYDGSTYDDFETVDTPSALGCYDMSGNVAEWVSDWYAPYGQESIQTNPQGPVDPLVGEFKAVRGGSYQKTPGGVRVTARDADVPPSESFESVGFRVAYFPIDCENRP